MNLTNLIKKDNLVKVFPSDRNSYETSSEESFNLNKEDIGEFGNIKDQQKNAINTSYDNSEELMEKFINNLNIKINLIEPEDLALKNFKDKHEQNINLKWEVQIETDLKV